MKKVLFSVFATAVLGGCATVDSATPPAEREEAVYRTGSNIPSKQRADDGVKAYDKDAAERMQRDSLPGMRPANPGGKPGA